MSILKSATLNGVWGEKDFACNFHPDINFLIGPNGSGKTTVINLLAAALTADHDALARIPFESIECEMCPQEEEKIGARIFVERVAQEIGAPIFNYELHLPGGTKQYELFPTTSLAYRVRLGRTSSRPRKGQEELTSALGELVHLKWLSVYRSPGKADSADARGESSVDRRLNILNNQLVRHFSKLAGLKEAATTFFISQVFLALVYRGNEENLFEVARKVNIKKLRDAMAAIFRQFNIDDDQSMQELNVFMDSAKKAVSRKTPESWADFQAVFGVTPIRKVVDEWNSTLAKQEQILRPQTDFLTIINSMLKGKDLEINQRNELEVILDNPAHKRLSLSDLSSGEKQLLIIFGEALLQDRTEFIYIADEPELSLHVTWQEHLTENLRKINPCAQVIFATHSPDIVSKYGDRVIDMGTK